MHRHQLLYEELSKLENFNKWSVWIVPDSTAVFTPTGKQMAMVMLLHHGKVNQEKAVLKSLLAGAIKKMPLTRLSFSPKNKCHFFLFTIHENNGLTTVTWDFSVATPRPGIFSMGLYSLDKEIEMILKSFIGPEKKSQKDKPVPILQKHLK